MEGESGILSYSRDNFSHTKRVIIYQAVDTKKPSRS